MDVRSIEDVEPVIEHNGTVPVWWLVNPREMFDITRGGHLELVSEFEVAGGGYVDPHHHPTHEFYYVTAGRGIMTIGDEEREIAQGDLVHIPPNAVHSLRPLSDHAPIHCFCFAVGTPDAGEVNYTAHGRKLPAADRSNTGNQPQQGIDSTRRSGDPGGSPFPVRLDVRRTGREGAV